MMHPPSKFIALNDLYTHLGQAKVEEVLGMTIDLTNDASKQYLLDNLDEVLSKLSQAAGPDLEVVRTDPPKCRACAFRVPQVTEEP